MSSAHDFTCVFCNEAFESKEVLQEHFRKHGDPNFNNGSKAKARPQNEQAVNEKTEDSEMVGCDVCDETFPSISKAITHKHKVHPDHDAKYFCPWCGKLFTMKHLYNKHMQSNHADVTRADEGTGYHCDCCEVEFYIPSAMVYHNKFFHRQDTELPSIGQSKKVKTYKQEMLQIYYCPFCGEEYNNKVNLHKHMGDDHEDENQRPEEVLRCPLCDAVFYHLDAYELHLSFHSTEDVYSDENELALGVTDFSLESVPPLMEKVEEEPKAAVGEGIDKFLQLIMDESRESGNTDTGDIRIKSKKHKKHKKSKKAAITLDEFLNMNKDVFGDGLDVQGIEEVPTQQVLKKYKGKNVTKPMPASALAKLKKQGITVKSNSSNNTPILKPNKNVTVNTAKILPNRIPMKVQEKPAVTATPNELLSKLLNQGNSQIKIVKKSAEDNSNKDKIQSQLDNQELTIQSLAQNKLSSNTSIPDETMNANDYEMEQDVNNMTTDNKTSEKQIDGSGENANKACMEVTNNMSHDSSNTKAGHNIYTKPVDNDVAENEHSESKLEIESAEILQNVNQTELLAHGNDKDDSFESNEDLQTKASDDEHIPDNKQVEPGTESKEDFEEENINKNASNKTLDALKHLSGLITIKPAQSTESKANAFEMGQVNSENNSQYTSDSIPSNVSKILGKNMSNVTVKKPNSPQINSVTPTKPIDTIKQFNNQLSIKTYPTGSPSSKVSEESEDNESDNDFHDDIPHRNVIKEDDNATFKTPIATVKQSNATIKASEIKKPVQVKSPLKEIKEEDDTKKAFNMDILKRLTNVTAKPVAKATNNVSVAKSSVHSVNYSKPVPKAEKNKVIDQDIEIFSIDDSDSDQEAPNEDAPTKSSVNIPKISETKASTSADVLKNLSKNITIKSPNQSNVRYVSNVKKEIHCESSRQSIERNVQSPGSTDNKVSFQKKQANMNLNSTLKKLGNNISIKSQYSSPDSHRFQMQPDDDMDDHFDMNEDEDESDSETPGKVKISEVREDEDLPSDTDMEYNDNVIVQSPQASNSENEEEHHSNHSDDEMNEDFESRIKMNTLTKEKAASNSCLDNFKRNNKELTIKSLNEKNTNFPQAGSPSNKREDAAHMTKNLGKNMSVKQFRESERQEDNEAKKVSQSAASSSQKVTNQVNTVKTVKTFQSETIIEEITTTVTKTIRTVNQSSKQVAQNANVSTYRPRLASPNQPARPLQGMTVRNAQSVGTKIRSAGPAPRPVVPSRAAGQLVPVRPQNQLVPRQGVYRPSMPGPSNIRKMSPQASAQKPTIGKPLKISPLAMNQSVKRPSDDIAGHFSCFKKPKDSMISSMDAFDDDFGDDASVNYSTATSSNFSATATKVVKGKSVVTATQARSEQHSEQHITKLNNMSGLKVVRSSAKQASQIETRTDNNMGAAKRTTLDAIERLQKQGLLIKKPRVETPEENEQYNSESEHEFDDE